jgi:hypothetical protein
VLFPQLEGVQVEGIERSADRLVITAAVVGREGCCPRCGTSSARVHSRYRRRVADAPIGGTPVAITLGVRRLFCDAPDCPKRTFAEQIPGLTSRYARRSLELGRMLTVAGLALAEPDRRPARRPVGARGQPLHAAADDPHRHNSINARPWAATPSTRPPSSTAQLTLPERSRPADTRDDHRVP